MGFELLVFRSWVPFCVRILIKCTTDAGIEEKKQQQQQQREIEKESDRKYENSNKIYHKLLFKFH